MIDPFGLRQEEPSSPPPEPEAPFAPPAPGRRRLWAVLLVLDTVLVFVFGGALVGMLLLNGTPPAFLQGWIEPPAPQKAAGNKRRPLAAEKEPAAAAAPAPAPSPAPEAKVQAPSASPETSLQEPRKARPVEFTCPGKNAKRVYLKGAFLVKTKGRQRMKKGSDGQWRLTVSLLPDNYKYKCSVNGKDSDSLTLEVAP